MSPSQDYYDWLNAGRPSDTAQPILDLAKTLRAKGYTAYIIGNDDQMKAHQPEDHTPFSHTGWPQPCPRWWITALDVMPKNGDMHDLANLARALMAAKDGGVEAADPIKYMNWTDEAGNCYHVSWESAKATRS